MTLKRRKTLSLFRLLYDMRSISDATKKGVSGNFMTQMHCITYNQPTTAVVITKACLNECETM